MPILPLPVYEADADPANRSAMSDEEIYARLEPPKTIVIRFGSMKLIGEFTYDGEAKPGCGSKLVARTHRGTELVEMLTATCSNSGCSKSITRQEMRDYIENSGGKDFPFYTDGKVLRIATIEDMNKHAALNADRKEHVKFCKALIQELMLEMKLVDVEPILGGELLTFYYMSEQRVDFRELVRRLASHFQARIEMRQVGARDEARLVADYERCGQHCCCKNFLKVLKPVSMKSAKIQKATLDPLKISGRCGRLMCCLRYEDATYTELRAKLPKNGTRVGTSDGPGIVIDSKILVQLVLVRLEHNETEIAVAVEELLDPETCPKPSDADFNKRRDDAAAEADPFRGMSSADVAKRSGQQGDDRPQRSDRKDRDSRRERPRRERTPQQDKFRERPDQPAPPPAADELGIPSDDRDGETDLPIDQEQGTSDDRAAGAPGDTPQGEPRRRGRRRRRRRRRGGGGGGGNPPSGGGPNGPPNPTGP